MKKKRVLFVLLSLLLIYVFWLGYQLIRFKTYDFEATKKDPLEIQGAYHIHSTYSDGRKHPDKIAQLASRSSLDFIVLTDHGLPNRECLASAGWKEGVLVLAGSELSVSRGHLVALGFDPPKDDFSQNAEQAAYQIKMLRGISVIAHPYSKVAWSWGKSTGYNGIEIINANAVLKYNLIRLALLSPILLVKPEYAFLKTLGRPQKNLKKWDEINQSQSMFGFYSVDAHLLYRPLLPFLQLHVLLNNPLSSDFEVASSQVYAALRRGRFYNAVDAAAQARGFRFWAQKGRDRLSMGENAVFDPAITLHIQVPLPFAKEIHLIHNGKKLLVTSKDDLDHTAASPGFYRVEVYLREKSPLHGDIPWILSNPIFLQDKAD
jgi:hypothetical protein